MYHLYVESKGKKKDTNELTCKTDTDSQTKRQIYGGRGKTGWGGLDWQFGICKYY